MNDDKTVGERIIILQSWQQADLEEYTALGSELEDLQKQVTELLDQIIRIEVDLAKIRVEKAKHKS